MELRTYVAIVRRRWVMVLALPLLVGLLSLVVGLARPAAYTVAVRLLVTRGDAPAESTAGLTGEGEDKTAQDLPAIVSGAPFAEDVAQELARRGRTVSPAAVRQSIQAADDQHVVYLSVTSADPAEAAAIAEAAVAAIKANGLRYWGDPRATPEHPGLNVGVLDPPAQASRVNGPRAIASEAALRALLGLIAGVGLAFGLHYLDEGRRTNDEGQAPAKLPGDL
jgi:capsular polysaccharide biosynthesis protein